MISCIQRANLNIEKYDECIEKSAQSKIYAYAWYLDIVCENWCALVLNDYEAVMPLPWRRKYMQTYIYPPFWVLELGIFSVKETIQPENFLKVLFEKFQFVELKMNTKNHCTSYSLQLLTKQMHSLSINTPYELITASYRKDRRKDLRKANRASLKKVWNDSPKQLITLFQNNIGKRVKALKTTDYVILELLITECLKREVGEILSVYDSANRLIGSGFFLKHKGDITLLVSSTDLEHRKNGVNTFLIDTAIQKYKKDFKVFHFGGSSIPSIGNYFLSFGAKETSYQQIKYNNLPKLFKWLKR